MADSSVQPGSLLGGDFEIVELLASGGMGAVYLAKQRSTGATRAVKTMHAHLTHDDDFQRRFAQEATIGTHIASEHVVQVLAAGIDDATGIPWIAMEHLRGEHLESYVTKKGRLSLAELIELFVQICHALGAAHNAHIVHRDLKPENIFVSPSQRVGEAYTVKILDFGIAKIRSASDAAAKSTSALGTPLWMAPEQLRMNGDIDARADVWALGLIAFYCLTGKSYWRTAADDDVDLAALVNEVAYAPLTNANVRATELRAPGLPTSVREWFERCVDRDRNKRFPDANVTLEALVAAVKSVDGFSKTLSPHSAAGVAVSRAASTTASAAFYTDASAAPADKQRVNPLVLAAGLVAAGGLCAFALARLNQESPANVAAATAPMAAPAPEKPVFRDPEPMVSLGGGVMTQGRAGGPTDEAPPHQVTVAAFRMDTHEVTVADYALCIERHACSPAGTDDECNAPRADRANHPINCVTYAQATAYCESLGERLPTEEEWEFAARGGTTRRFPWGDTPPADDTACFKRGEGDLDTCPIASHPKGRTPTGLDDLAGNVWEWTSTNYCPYDHPSCDDARRVARGGAYTSQSSELLTATVRMAFAENTSGSTVGFRCVKTR